MQRIDDSFFRADEIKSIFVFIIFMMLVLASLILFFINNRKADREHRGIIALRNDAIQAIESLLLHSSNTHRALLNLAIATDTPDVRLMMGRIHDASEKSDLAFVRIERLAPAMSASQRSLLDTLKSAWKNYQAAYSTFLGLLDTGGAGANEFRVSKLRPSLDDYQYRQQDFLVMLTDDTIQKSNMISERYSRNNWIFLALGVSPYLFFTFSILYLVFKAGMRGSPMKNFTFD